MLAYWSTPLKASVKTCRNFALATNTLGNKLLYFSLCSQNIFKILLITHYQHFKYRWGTREMLLEVEQHHPLPLEKERRWEHVSWKLNQISNRADQLPKDLVFIFLIRIFTCFRCFVWHRIAQFKLLFSYPFDSSYKTLCMKLGQLQKLGPFC